MSNALSAKPLVELPVNDFLRRLAGSDPTPGGGSASALAGAVAASLVTMVGGLTTGRAGFEEVAETIEIMVEQGHQIATVLTAAVDRDAAAYDQVTAAFKLPKATDEEKAARSAAIQAAMTHAADVPFEVAEECLAAAELAMIALEKGNPNATSDASVALLQALTGLEGAVLNVAINLDSIKDATYVTEKKAELKRLMTRADELRAANWQIVRGRFQALS
ncbi:cyclodeaminase/cyclohydrolase family protein [bacterium]|nr:cyclodeaminase/cyclohydrolase family protein [bacterium]